MQDVLLSPSLLLALIHSLNFSQEVTEVRLKLWDWRSPGTSAPTLVLLYVKLRWSLVVSSAGSLQDAVNFSS